MEQTKSAEVSSSADLQKTIENYQAAFDAFVKVRKGLKELLEQRYKGKLVRYRGNEAIISGAAVLVSGFLGAHGQLMTGFQLGTEEGEVIFDSANGKLEDIEILA